MPAEDISPTGSATDHSADPISVGELGCFQLDHRAGRLLCGDEVIALRRKTWDVLCYFAERRGVLIERDELLDRVWEGSAVVPKVLTNVIGELRRVFERHGDEDLGSCAIETEYGRGYRLVVESAAAPSEAAEGIVGREEEIQFLLDRWKLALSGERQFVFVSGEPGIGKTTLLEAFVERSRTHGRRTRLQGVCLEHYGESEPYLPVLEALEYLTKRLDLAETLAQEAPTWAVQVPWLYDEERVSKLRASLAGIGASRMLREGAHLVERLCETQPMLLVLEDLQWCDLATLDLLQTLAERRSPAPLMAVATFRPVDALLREHRLSSVVAKLSRRGRAEEIVLEGLDRRAIGTFLDQRFPEADLSEEAAVVIEERTGGNPLFLEAATVKLGSEGLRRLRSSELSDGPLATLDLPEDLQATLREELGQLDDRSRLLLETASVAEPTFTVVELAAATGEDEDAVEEVLEGLAHRRLFVTRSGRENWPDGTTSSAFAFRHALYRQALESSVPAARTRRALVRMGERLESAFREDLVRVAGRLASLYERADEWEKACDYLELAAGNAAARYALREAVLYLERLLSGFERLPSAKRSPTREASRWLDLGNCVTPLSTHHDPRARDAYDKALGLAREAGEPVLGIRAQLGRGLNASLSTAPDAQRIIEELLTEVGDHPSLQPAAYFYACFNAMGDGHLNRVESHLVKAREGDPMPGIPTGMDLESAIDGYDGLHRAIRGQPARELIQRSLQRAARVGTPGVQMMAIYMGCSIATVQRNLEEARTLAEEALELASANDITNWISTVQTLSAWCATADQPVAVRIEQLQRTFRERQRLGEVWWNSLFLGLLAELEVERGDLELAEQYLDEAFEVPEAIWTAELYRTAGDLERARLESIPRATFSASAKTAYRRALAVSERQGAGLLYLRSAERLADLLSLEGRTADASELLTDALSRVTVNAEESSDVRSARAMLSRLRA